MAERNVEVDHVTIWRWIQYYAPELSRRCRPELRKTNGSWRVDETYLRGVANGPIYPERWIPPATRLISCSLQPVMRVLPSASFKEHYSQQTIDLRESST